MKMMMLNLEIQFVVPSVSNSKDILDFNQSLQKVPFRDISVKSS